MMLSALNRRFPDSIEWEDVYAAENPYFNEEFPPIPLAFRRYYSKDKPKRDQEEKKGESGKKA